MLGYLSQFFWVFKASNIDNFENNIFEFCDLFSADKVPGLNAKMANFIKVNLSNNSLLVLQNSPSFAFKLKKKYFLVDVSWCSNQNLMPKCPKNRLGD